MFEIIDDVTAVKEVFISESHKLAMAAEGDDMESVNTRLTKENEAPPPSDETTDGLSTIT